MIALSIPKPAIADNKCSTVDTRTSPLVKVVESIVSPTFSAIAFISTGGFKSERRKIIPVSTGAGWSVRKTFSPV